MGTFDIVKKVALVTGGASGIGLSVAKELLRDGLKAIAILDINETSGQKALEEIESEFGDGKAIFIKVNVANKHQFEDAFKKIIETFQNLDIVINNAGIFKDYQWEEAIATNFTGTVNGTILAFENYLPKYKSGTEGVILNVASITGLDVFIGAPIYSATKCAVIGLTRSFGHKLNSARNNIRVIGICPGYTNTSMLSEGDEKYLGPAYLKVDNIQNHSVTIQPATCVAKAMVKIIKKSETGSIWVSEDDRAPYEIEFRTRQQSKKLN